MRPRGASGTGPPAHLRVLPARPPAGVYEVGVTVVATFQPTSQGCCGDTVIRATVDGTRCAEPGAARLQTEGPSLTPEHCSLARSLSSLCGPCFFLLLFRPGTSLPQPSSRSTWPAQQRPASHGLPSPAPALPRVTHSLSLSTGSMNRMNVKTSSVKILIIGGFGVFVFFFKFYSRGFQGGSGFSFLSPLGFSPCVGLASRVKARAAPTHSHGSWAGCVASRALLFPFQNWDPSCRASRRR